MANTAIHPKKREVSVTCGGCNNMFVIRNGLSQDEFRVEVCYKCHSAYTKVRREAKAKAVDRFKARYGDMSAAFAAGASKKKSEDA